MSILNKIVEVCKIAERYDIPKEEKCCIDSIYLEKEIKERILEYKYIIVSPENFEKICNDEDLTAVGDMHDECNGIELKIWTGKQEVLKGTAYPALSFSLTELHGGYYRVVDFEFTIDGESILKYIMDEKKEEKAIFLYNIDEKINVNDF